MELPALNSEQGKKEMEQLLQNFEIEARGQVVPLRLCSGLRKRWDLFGDDLLHCFNNPGLPRTVLRLKPCLESYVVVNDASADVNPRNH